MKSTHSFVVVSLLFVATLAQPENDLCADATALTVNGESVNGTLEELNLVSDEEIQMPVCLDPNLAFGNISGAEDSIWYSVVGTGAGLVASLCNTLAAIAVYTDNCENPECVSVPRIDTEGYCPDETPGTYSSWYGSEGVTYKLRVHERGVPVPFTMRVFALESFAPHDVCENARMIPATGRVDDVFDQNISSIDLGYPSCGVASERSGQLGTSGLWYLFKGTGTTIRVSPACGDSFKIGIRVYSGTCNALICAGDHNVSQNVCGEGFSEEDVVLVETVEGQDYYILVEDDHTGGDISFNLREYTSQAGVIGRMQSYFLMAVSFSSTFLFI